MSRTKEHWDELITIDGTSILLKVQRSEDGVCPTTVRVQVPLLQVQDPKNFAPGLFVKKQTDDELSITVKEFILVRDYKTYAVYHEMRKRIGGKK